MKKGIIFVSVLLFSTILFAEDYQVRLYDSYGDGWDVAYGGPNLLNVTVDGVLLLDGIYLADGSGPEAYTFAVEAGSDVVVEFTAVGDYPEENSYDIVNEEEVVIYTSPAPPEASYNFIVGVIEIPDVFFSEYIEGSGNNKAIEIYNGTEEEIDLANFQINQAVNGGGWEYIHTFPEGAMLAANDVWVIAADQLGTDLYPEALCDEFLAYPSVVHYNGDDARALEYFTMGQWHIIDIIGTPDEDPGAGWEVAGIANGTKNHTLVRKDAIITGNDDWAASAGTNADDSEWVVYDENTFEYLGWHIDQPSYVAGTVTLDAFGDVTDTQITIGDVVTFPAADSSYIVQVVPGIYDVVANMPGYDPITTAGVECVVGVVSTVDFAMAVIPETLWPPVNLTAEIDMNNVNVAWTAPTQYGWNGYYSGPYFISWGSPERSMYFDVTDFGFSYPMTLSQISHEFYHHPDYPWGDDTTFTFKIYDADGTTVLYLSDVQTALAYPESNILELDIPLTVTDNFYVAIVPTGASGHPTSLADPDTENLHGYVGEAGNWGEPAYDFSTQVYIMGDEGDELLTYSTPNKEIANSTQSSRKVKRTDYAKIDGFIPEDSRDLLSFNVFRDGVKLNTEPVYAVSYVDLAVPAGEYTYHATALWNFGESDPSNTATVNLVLGDLSGIVTEEDGTTPIEGAIVAADEYSATSIAGGTYLIEDMLIGIYEVTCSAAGFVTSDPVSVEITDGGNTVVDFSLIDKPPVDVAVDEELGIVSWIAPSADPIIDDNFDSYTVGDHLAQVSADWTTWSNAPGGTEDGVISDAQASSPSNSLLIEETNDQVLIMEDYTEGVYVIEHDMYVPSGFCGYWNLQKTSSPGEEWGFQVQFDVTGEAIVDAGAAAALVYTFPFDTWMHQKVIVDLDNDLATYYVDGVEMIEYQWTLGSFGTSGLLQLGGMNLYAWASAGNSPQCYFDNVVLSQPADLTGYNVYLDGELDGTVGDDVLDYMYTDLVDGQAYTAGVSALYGTYETEIIEVGFIYNPVTDFNPPSNPAAVVEDYNDVLVTWEAPSADANSLHGILLKAVVKSSSRESRSLVGYTVYRDSTEIAVIDDPAILSFLDESLDAGTYEYTLEAYYTYPEGTSGLTDPVTATVVLPAPENPIANTAGFNIMVSWNAPTRSFETYNVYRDGDQIATSIANTFYLDQEVATGYYIYNITAVYSGGYESAMSDNAEIDHVDVSNVLVPTVTELTGNYPNPFNPTTTISFSLAETSQVSINIFNLRGQLVKTLVNGEMEAAYHTQVWNGTDNSDKKVSSGVYFYSLTTSDYGSTKKMILMK